MIVKSTFLDQIFVVVEMCCFPFLFIPDLKKLQHINLSNNKQLTNNICQSLAGKLQSLDRNCHQATKVNFIIPCSMETEMQNTGPNSLITIA